MSPKRSSVDPDEIRKLYVEEGWNLSRIARHLSVSNWAVKVKDRAKAGLGTAIRPRGVLNDKAARGVRPSKG